MMDALSSVVSSVACGSRLLVLICTYCLPARRYVDRLSGNLHRKAGQEAKMLAAAAETQAKQQESRALLAGFQPKVRSACALRVCRASITDDQFSSYCGGETFCWWLWGSSKRVPRPRQVCSAWLSYQQCSACFVLLPAPCSTCFMQLSEIVSRTRTIKTAVEAAVSKQFAGRRVNVLGEINNALSSAT